MGSGRSPDDPSSGNDGPARSDPAHGLSELERSILRLLSAPYRAPVSEHVPAANQSIADDLGLTVDKVRTHLKQLYARFEIGTSENLRPHQMRHRLAEIALGLDLEDEDAGDSPALPMPATAQDVKLLRASRVPAAVQDAEGSDPDAVTLRTGPPGGSGGEPPATGRMPAVAGASRGGRRLIKVAAAAGLVGALVAGALVVGAGRDSTDRHTTTQRAAEAPATIAAQVLVLVDVSRTMKRPLDRRRPQDGTRIEAARELVGTTVANMSAPDEIGVWLLSSSREGLPDACGDRSAPCELQPLVAASDDVIAGLRPPLAGLRANAGSTPLYEVIERGVRALRDSGAPRSVIRSLVVVTDGVEPEQRAGSVRLAAGTGKGVPVQIFVAAVGRRLCDGEPMRVVSAGFASRCYEATSLTSTGAALRGVLDGVTRRVPAPAAVGSGSARSSRSCPAGKIRVPDVVGKNHQLAQDTMQAAGLLLLTERDASGQARRLIFDRDWTTVRQRPTAGSCVTASTIILLTAKRNRR